MMKDIKIKKKSIDFHRSKLPCPLNSEKVPNEIFYVTLQKTTIKHCKNPVNLVMASLADA